MSTSTASVFPRSSDSSASASANGDRTASRKTCPDRLITPRRSPFASTTVCPRPGLPFGKLAGRTMRGSRVEVLVDLAVAVGVVAERDRVDAEGEQLLRGLARDPDAAGGVLAVDHDEVGLVLLPQRGQQGRRAYAGRCRRPRRLRTGASRRAILPTCPRGDPDHHARRARPGQALRRARGAARRLAVRRTRRAGGRDRPQRRGQDDPAVDPRRHPAPRRGHDLGRAGAGRLGAPAGRRSTASSPWRRT